MVQTALGEAYIPCWQDFKHMEAPPADMTIVWNWECTYCCLKVQPARSAGIGMLPNPLWEAYSTCWQDFDHMEAAPSDMTMLWNWECTYRQAAMGPGVVLLLQSATGTFCRYRYAT